LPPPPRHALFRTTGTAPERLSPDSLRVIDSLQLGDKNKITTPANWQPGGKVIVHPSVKTEDAKEMFPNGVDVVYPYLRFTTL
ncbi:hypothetical protein JCM10212_003761, partial [Sporobolomyces blumeae]